MAPIGYQNDHHSPQFSWAPGRVGTYVCRYIGRWVTSKEYLMLRVKPSLSTSADVPPRIRPYNRGSQYVRIVVKKSGGRARESCLPSIEVGLNTYLAFSLFFEIK